MIGRTIGDLLPRHVNLSGEPKKSSKRFDLTVFVYLYFQQGIWILEIGGKSTIIYGRCRKKAKHH